MRSALALSLLLLSCAHGPRPVQPERWHELETENFILRTDLPITDARRVAVDLEEVRETLLTASWHRRDLPGGKTQVIVLADDRELPRVRHEGAPGVRRRKRLWRADHG